MLITSRIHCGNISVGFTTANLQSHLYTLVPQNHYLTATGIIKEMVHAQTTQDLLGTTFFMAGGKRKFHHVKNTNYI